MMVGVDAEDGVEDAASVPRAERRRRTEGSILAAARRTFAEYGYERATVRGVAIQAGVDPALVMHYFGTKARLFAAAAVWPEEHQRVKVAESDGLPAAALADLFGLFETPGDSDAVLALVRSCLTHPAATAILRDDIANGRSARAATELDGPAAEHRASLMGACMMGLALSRYVIRTEPLASASRDDIERLFSPVLRALVEPPR